MKLSVVIPVYKSSGTLINLFSRIRNTLDVSFDYEVILVCDHPVDNSWDIVKRLKSEYPDIVSGVNLLRNYGQHRALLTGIKMATGEFIITIDEDLQHDPVFIPAMLDHLIRNNLDVVYGKFEKPAVNRLRSLESRTGRKVAGFFIPSLYHEYSPYRIIRASVAPKITDVKGVVFIDALLGRVTTAFGSFQMKHLRNERPTSYSFMKRSLMAFSIFFWYSKLIRIFITICILIFLVLLAGWGPDFSLPLKTSVLFISGILMVLIFASGFENLRTRNIQIFETTAK